MPEHGLIYLRTLYTSCRNSIATQNGLGPSLLFAKCAFISDPQSTINQKQGQMRVYGLVNHSTAQSYRNIIYYIRSRTNEGSQAFAAHLQQCLHYLIEFKRGTVISSSRKWGSSSSQQDTVF